ncbi:MAG: DNA cytosine methyltransferase [Bacteroidaceae bacterium]|nr:DNA cytosine methyltransferase [Bacteroidaceae bacterium]
MKVVSIFAGCGGLDLGFEKAGFDVVWANEYDSSIHATYRLNHPNTQLCTLDIRNIKANDIPDCDGIIGGPPCQSWSLGGKSLGIEDERGKLVYDYIRIVKDKKPKFFIMENVPGMVTPKHIDAFNEFLNLFRNAGYVVKYELMNAADFKIPQDRQRVIIVGIRNDMNVEYLFPTKQESTPITLLRAIGDIKTPPKPYYSEKVNVECSIIPNHDYYTGPYDSKFMARNRVRGWEELSFTIQAQAKNEPLHPQAPKMVYVSSNERKFVEGKEHLYRRLSVRECARIQTFPDTFKFIYEKVTDGYKMVGNAVPPRLAYHIALSIRQCFSMSMSPSSNTVMALIGYVKSESDFKIIRRENIYYIRGGNRPGAMQYGQLTKPIKWLLLHKGEHIELFELVTGKAERCTQLFLRNLGFHPKGNEYWFFRIKQVIKEDSVVSTIIREVKEFKHSPHIVNIENIVR